MDYSKFTKEELIEICKLKELSFSSSLTREELEKILIDNDNLGKKSKDKIITQTDNLGKVGALINIIFGSITLVFWEILSLFIIDIPFLILNIFQ